MVLFNGTLCSAEIPPPCLVYVKSFFASLQSGNPEKAVKELMIAKAKWGGREEAIKMVSVLQSMNTDVIGKYYGNDIIHYKVISKDYFVIVVMAKYESSHYFSSLRSIGLILSLSLIRLI